MDPERTDVPPDRPEQAMPPPRPRWVKALGIVLALVVLAIVVMAVAGGEHGPGRHVPGSGSPAGQAPPAQQDS